MLDSTRIAILVEQDFEDAELTEPLPGHEGGRGQDDISRQWLPERATKARGVQPRSRLTPMPDQVRADYFDAVIIPGGYAPDKMRMHKPMIDLVRKAHDLGRLVAAICHGPQLLISSRGGQRTKGNVMAFDCRRPDERRCYLG